MTMMRAAAWRSRAVDPRAVDAVVVLACLGLTVLAVKGRWSAVPPPVIGVAGVAASAAQWWRRRWPLAAVVAGAVGYALSGNPGPPVVGLYSCGAYASRALAGLAAIVGWFGFAGWAWIDGGRLSVNDALAAAVAGLVPVAAGVYMGTRRALVDSWRERAERVETERRLRDDRARADERTRIAREMHDVLAHKVSLIALHAGALELTARGGSPPVERGAALIRTTAREALQELRYVLGVLRAGSGAWPDDDPPPFADLAALVGAARQAGQPVELVDDAGSLPPATARVVYRVAQEGLTNARKHAAGAPVTVAVHRDGDAISVTVRNARAAGPPLDLPGSGSGLIGLAERVRLAGGSLQSGPIDGDGWRLAAVVPWLDHAPEEGSA